MPQVQEVETLVTLSRNSERASYRNCRFAWDLSYNRKLSTPRPKGALTFGTGIHHALELRYPPGKKRGPHPALSWEAWFKENKDLFHQWDEEGNRHEALELGISMMNNYVDLYGEDDHVNIIAPETAMSVPICDRQGNYLCHWVGRIDATYEDLSKSRKNRRRIGFLEHKTAKQIEHNLRINSGYGEQGLSYAWAGSIFLEEQGILQKGDGIDHVLYNWLRKGLPSTKPVSADGYTLNKPKKDALLAYCAQHGLPLAAKPKVEDLEEAIRGSGYDPALLGEPSKVQPSPLLVRAELDFGDHELSELKRRIVAEAWERQQVRDGKLPIYKNPSKDCSWRCEFIDVCELHEMGEDWEAMLELEFETWEPHADYEVEIK